MDHEKLCQAIKNIAWGYLLIHLHFKLGTLDILPDFAGYLLILGALPSLGQLEPSARLLKPFCIGLVLWNFLLWLASIVGITSFGYLPSLLFSIVGLYFHFQLLTNIAAVARAYNSPQEKSILHLRTILTIMRVLLTLPLPWDDMNALAVLMLLFTLVLTFAICAILFSLHRFLRENPPKEEATEDFLL